jgi:hypothetical protein
LFTSPLEFLLGLFAVGLSLSLKQGRSRVDFYNLRLIAYVVIFVIAWPLVFKKYSVLGVTIILFSFGFIFKELSKKKTALCICLLIVLFLAPFFENIFNYLQNSRAKRNFFFDDARLALRKTPREYYDILVIDAFSGDSVPVHLLTTDTIREYKAHMKDKRLILFHISNRYLDLAPVLFSNASAVNAFALSGWNEAQGPALFASQWMVLTWDRQINHTLVSELQWKENAADPKKEMLRPWTDTYSNIPSVVKPNAFIDSIKNFTPFSW